jgi:hypothetical protein
VHVQHAASAITCPPCRRRAAWTSRPVGSTGHLFDPTSSYAGVDWDIDEAMTRSITEARA